MELPASSRTTLPTPPAQPAPGPQLPSFLRASRRLLKPQSPPHEKPKLSRPAPARSHRPLSVPRQPQDSSQSWKGKTDSFVVFLSYGVNLQAQKQLPAALQWLEKAAAEVAGNELGFLHACTLMSQIHSEVNDAQMKMLDCAESALAATSSPELKLLAQLNAGFAAERCGNRRRATQLQTDLIETCSVLLGLKRPGDVKVREKVMQLASEVLAAMRPGETCFSRFGIVRVAETFPEVRLWEREDLLPPDAETLKVTKAMASAEEKMETHKAQILGAIGVFDPLDF